MHFSTFAVSLLASNAMAWRWGNQNVHYEEHVVTRVVTVTAPVQYVQPAQPTTLITRKAPVVSTTTTKKVVAAAPTAAAAAAEEASSGSGSSSGSSSLTEDQQNALDAHNAARSEVGTEPLTWDDALAADAQSWADHIASLGSLTHSQTSGQGENLYMQSGSDAPFTNAVNAFVSEKSSYSGQAIDGSNYMTFGHYTQVVWKSTTKVGMAIASGSSGTFVVARYQEPGNMIGETAY
ncbi:hypothetical protein ACJ41O_003569 [Fusarium nematophilum]